MNRKIIIAIAAVAMLQVGLASSATALLAAPGSEVAPAALVDRYVPRSPGVEKDMTFFFGPFTIPPGQDMNRVTVDLPLYDGFVTAIAPNLVDAATGETPTDLEMHIHHAHWFRVSSDPGDEYYTLNLAWVFGTGEERTQGSFNDRSAAEPGGPRYGIFVPGGQPQALIFMLHNKAAVARNMYIVLDVSFVYGTQEQIRSAESCPDLEVLAGDLCSAGQDFHAVKGRLWGTTFDVPRDFVGDGVYTHPRDIPPGPERRATDALGRYFVAPYAGTLIASAGHLHPNGRAVIVANLGPAGSGCDADLDGDGYPGTTLFESVKMNRVPEAGMRSEEYQMGATQYGFRAPIRAGDRITQFAIYENGDHASYEAMSYVGVYIDREQVPAARPAGACTVDAMKPYLVDDPQGDPTQTILNHAWDHDPLPYCGPGLGPDCDLPAEDKGEGLETNTVHVGGFVYLPGDQSFGGAMGAPPRVKQGESLTFVNDDAAAGVRHTVTSCPWPCNGPYVANYPQPDGIFDSGKLGNLDYIDGGITGDDTVPVWKTPADLEPGLYSYYCRVHPTMRGTFEVVE